MIQSDLSLGLTKLAAEISPALFFPSGFISYRGDDCKFICPSGTKIQYKAGYPRKILRIYYDTL